jgi:hypothetical protein
MKLLRVIGTTGLFLLVGTTAAAYAPRDRQEQGDKDKQEEKAKPATQDEKDKAAKPEEKAKPAKQEETAKPAAQEEKAKPTKQEEAAKPTKQEQAAKPAKQDDKQAKQEQGKQSAQESKREGGTNGDHGRISDEHYRANFGSGHNFHVNQGDYKNRRFQYGGYSFGFIDPWPVAWYYTDDVYVVYDNGGYFMYNVVHPGIRISVSIL